MRFGPRQRSALLILFGWTLAVFVTPISNLNVENWAAANGLDRLLVDGLPAGVRQAAGALVVGFGEYVLWPFRAVYRQWRPSHPMPI